MSKTEPGHSRAAADAVAAAARMLGAHRRSLLKAIRAFEAAPRGAKSVRAVHEVRVATRRAAVTVDAFSELMGEKDAKRTRRVLQAIRRSCGDARDTDVLLAWVKATHSAEDASLLAGLAHLERVLRERRRTAKGKLLEKLPRLARKLGKRLAQASDIKDLDDMPRPTMAEAARSTLERSTNKVLAAAAADLQDVECLHGLRIACKRLRYGIELFQPTLGKRVTRALLGPLESFQEHLGGFTDASTRTAFVEQVLAAFADTPRGSRRPSGSTSDRAALSALRVLLRRERAALRRGQKEAIAAWRTIEQGGLIDDLRRAALGPDRETAPHNPAGKQVESATRPIRFAAGQVAGLATANGHVRESVAKPTGRKRKRRLAAIDIGTNSIRLIVAEAAPDGTYRVLDDEKEITRLGRGMHKSGLLDPATQEHSAITIARMMSIAAGYGAQEVRVVATAACREAKNVPEFIDLVKERAGAEVEVIPPEQEALLAYRSAARAFGLAGIPAAVVDIGGGSLEVVLSAGSGRDDPRGAGLGGGVIERVHSLPLGAVRLTEQFGGTERSSGKRYKDLVRFVRAKLRKSIGKPPLVPQLVVGTGGTFTTLAAIIANKELGPAAAGLLSGGVQGREIRRADLRHVLAYLRERSVKERSKIAGLPADRADIIVAGLVVIDELLGFLQVNSVFVHEGGIRDGLLLSMVGPESPDAGRRDISPLRGVKRLAKACNYEAAHAGHVTRLALRIFDQLGAQTESLHAPGGDPGTRFNPRDRLLLESAAILHDVGYLINYASHHKHSYHLIVHAELPGLTSREIQIIANVARYHRAAEPKVDHRNFSTLNTEDQLLVRALSAILRVADGLDRTHMQQVDGVTIRVEEGAAHFEVTAEAEPAVDLWGAARKSRLFDRVFGLSPHFEWRASSVVG